MPGRKRLVTLHAALQEELGRDYRSRAYKRPIVAKARHPGPDPFAPSLDSQLVMRCYEHERNAFRDACYSKGKRYATVLRELMARYVRGEIG